MPPSPTLTPIVSVVLAIRVAAISASSRSRCALVLAARDVVLPGAIGAAGRGHGQLLRDEEVGGVAVGDLLHVAALADLRHVLRQDDLHALRSSLLIQARVRGPRPSCFMASPTAADELGDAADGPPDRTRRQAADLGDVAIEFGAVDAELGELLLEQVVGHAIEEQLDGEDDDDEVIEAADDRRCRRG